MCAIFIHHTPVFQVSAQSHLCCIDSRMMFSLVLYAPPTVNLECAGWRLVAWSCIVKVDFFTGANFKMKMVDIDGMRVNLQVLDVPLCISNVERSLPAV
jgi:hypothetical protein